MRPSSPRSWQAGVRQWQEQAQRDLSHSLDEVARLIAKRSNQQLPPRPPASGTLKPASTSQALPLRVSLKQMRAASSASSWTRLSSPSLGEAACEQLLKELSAPHPLGVQPLALIPTASNCTPVLEPRPGGGPVSWPLVYEQLLNDLQPTHPLGVPEIKPAAAEPLASAPAGRPAAFQLFYEQFLTELQDPHPLGVLQGPHPQGVLEIEPTAPEPTAAAARPLALIRLQAATEAELPSSGAASPTTLLHPLAPTVPADASSRQNCCGDSGGGERLA